jgi:hypothetical protein
MIWGTGTSARGRVRRLRVFEQPDAGRDACDDLASVINIVRSEGATAAYTYLHGNEGNIVRHLGSSFGTKFLYFCGYDACPVGFKPLILDRYVARAVNRLCGLDWPENSFSAAQYQHYVEIADAWATAWNTDPDVIERVLFSVGKSSPLAVGALRGAGYPSEAT